MRVATSGLMSATPIFAKIAVRAAKAADSKAQICHDAIAASFPFRKPSGRRRECHTPLRPRSRGRTRRRTRTLTEGGTRTTFPRELGEPRQGAERPAGAVRQRGLATLEPDPVNAGVGK